MGLEVAVILGLVSLFGTLVGVATNSENNQFIEDMNKENQAFQEQTNLQNHAWSLEAAQWEYDHEKPQRQYADLLSAGITPAAAAQKISGANVSYSPATAVAPQNMPKSTNMLNDSLMQVIGEIGDYSSMSQAQASAEKTKAETKVISETAIKKANAEIENILVNTLKSYSDINVNESQIDVNESQIDVNESKIDVNNANVDLTNEKVETEKVNRLAIELSNQEKEIQLEFTRKTLERSLEKTELEIKFLSEQTAKLKEEINGVNFDNAYKQWVNAYIDTYGVSPDADWQNMFAKAIADGKAGPLLDSFSQSLRQVFAPVDGEFDSFKSRLEHDWENSWIKGTGDFFEDKLGFRPFPILGSWYNRGLGFWNNRVK